MFGNFSLTPNPPNREDESVMKTDLEDNHDDQDHPDHHGDHDDLDGKEEEDESDGDIVPNPDTVEYEVDNTWEAEVEPKNDIKTNYLLFIGQPLPLHYILSSSSSSFQPNSSSQIYSKCSSFCPGPKSSAFGSMP